MHNIELYLLSDEELVWEQTACLERLYDFNQTRPGEMEKRTAMLKEMFASNSVSFQVWSTPRTVSASQQTILGLLCVSLAAPDNRWHKCHLLSNKT